MSIATSCGAAVTWHKLIGQFMLVKYAQMASIIAKREWICPREYLPNR